MYTVCYSAYSALISLSRRHKWQHFHILKRNRGHQTTTKTNLLETATTSACLSGIKHYLQLLFKTMACKFFFLPWNIRLKIIDDKLTSIKTNGFHFFSCTPPKCLYWDYVSLVRGYEFHNCFMSATNSCVQLSTIITTVMTVQYHSLFGLQICKNAQTQLKENILRTLATFWKGSLRVMNKCLSKILVKCL